MADVVQYVVVLGGVVVEHPPRTMVFDLDDLKAETDHDEVEDLLRRAGELGAELVVTACRRWLHEHPRWMQVEVLFEIEKHGGTRDDAYEQVYDLLQRNVDGAMPEGMSWAMLEECVRVLPEEE